LVAASAALCLCFFVVQKIRQKANEFAKI